MTITINARRRLRDSYGTQAWINNFGELCIEADYGYERQLIVLSANAGEQLSEIIREWLDWLREADNTSEIDQRIGEDR